MTTIIQLLVGPLTTLAPLGDMSASVATPTKNDVVKSKKSTMNCENIVAQLYFDDLVVNKFVNDKYVYRIYSIAFFFNLFTLAGYLGA